MSLLFQYLLFSSNSILEIPGNTVVNLSTLDIDIVLPFIRFSLLKIISSFIVEGYKKIKLLVCYV